MIIQCISCGYSHFINPKGSAEELEQRVADAIEYGWRWSSNFNGYVCGHCKQDKLHETFCGKIRKASKKKSYMTLMYDFIYYVKNLKELEN